MAKTIGKVAGRISLCIIFFPFLLSLCTWVGFGPGTAHTTFLYSIQFSPQRLCTIPWQMEGGRFYSASPVYVNLSYAFAWGFSSFQVPLLSGAWEPASCKTITYPSRFTPISFSLDMPTTYEPSHYFSTVIYKYRKENCQHVQSLQSRRPIVSIPSIQGLNTSGTTTTPRSASHPFSKIAANTRGTAIAVPFTVCGNRDSFGAPPRTRVASRRLW